MAKKTIKRPTLLWVGILIVLIPIFLSYTGILFAADCPFTPPEQISSCYNQDTFKFISCGVAYYADCDSQNNPNYKCIFSTLNNDEGCYPDSEGSTNSIITPVCNIGENWLSTQCTIPSGTTATTTVTSSFTTTSTTTLPSGGCTSTRWLPETSTVCSTEQFTQTSDCGVTRTATGTKDCGTGGGNGDGGTTTGFNFGEFLNQVLFKIPTGEGKEFEITGLIALIIGGAFILLAVI